MEKNLKDVVDFPMRNAQWVAWIEGHEAEFRDLLRTQSEVRRARSSCLMATDAELPAAPRLQPAAGGLRQSTDCQPTSAVCRLTVSYCRLARRLHVPMQGTYLAAAVAAAAAAMPTPAGAADMTQLVMAVGVCS